MRCSGRQRSTGGQGRVVETVGCDVTASRQTKHADLVLAGGGVKGIGLVGALVALMDDGYTFQRVSGTSAGAVVGSIVAAASQGQQLTGAQVKELALGLDYGKFVNAWPIDGLPVVGRSWALLRGIGAALRGTGVLWVSFPVWARWPGSR